MNKEELFILELKKGIIFNYLNLYLTCSDEYTSAKYIKAKELEEEKEALLDQEVRNNQHQLRLKEIGVFTS
jgi:hypothetical protein